MDYAIRKAVAEDISVILAIYARAREYMAQMGNPNQWGTTNPPAELLVNDIAEWKLHVVENESGIHGVFYFAVEKDPTYTCIHDGEWHRDDAYGVIHRIAGDGSGGILRTAIAYASEMIDYLRIDTHHDNIVMQKALDRLGFRKCGIIYVDDGSPRIAYDR